MTDQESIVVINPEEGPKRSKIWWIMLIVGLVIIFCCCAVVLIFYYWLGDLIIQIINNISYQFGTSYY